MPGSKYRIKAPMMACMAKAPPTVRQFIERRLLENAKAMANNRATPNKLIMCIPLQKCLLDVRLDDIQSDLVFTALSYHDIGREAAGLNKLMIHGLHGSFVLLGY